MQDARSLASVIGEDELGEVDRQYLKFGRAFENYFINQSMTLSRSIDETLDLGWQLLSLLPKQELDRMDSATIDAHYVEDAYQSLQDGPSNRF